jgi:uncharacterized peroxidase-related enzyme
MLLRTASHTKSMFLKEIETKPAEGLTKLAFQRLRDTGETIPEILHLFRFKRRATDHLVRFTEEVMRGPSPLSPGLRELIGAYFSKKSQCSFCSDAHAAAAAEFLERELIDEVLNDLESSRLDEPHKALFRYLGKLAENPGRVTAKDINKLKGVGWSEEAIYDALTVASVFRFYNTWNNGSGVQNMTPADYEHSGRVLLEMGYCMDFKLTRFIKLVAGKFLVWAKAVLFAGNKKDSGQRRPWLKRSPGRLTST